MGYLTPSLFAPLIGATFALVVLHKLAKFFIKIYKSPLRDLPGPPSPSWIWGQFRVMINSQPGDLHDEWVAKYGKNIWYTEILSTNRLYTMDTRAVNHILTHSTEFQKPKVARQSLINFVGEGLLVAEDEDHRRQRRVLNPAFGPVQIRELTPVFLSKAAQLRDLWVSELGESDQSKRIDVLGWMSRATLDIIGLAGFDYDFKNLETGTMNELSEAFKVIFGGSNASRVWAFIRLRYPILKLFPSVQSRRMSEAKAAMTRIGMQMIEERKKAIQSEKTGEKNEFGRKDLEGRDLLSLLLKANLATDIPASQKLGDEEVLAQIPTFLVAGHETTSTAVTWCLFALTQALRVQDKLRQELLAVDSETPSMDELMALPYLDMVVRETLRVHAPVPSTIRQAQEDEVIPVGEPYTDRHGEVRDEIRVLKGDVIVVPILSLNRSKEIWGPDAMEFNPERWETPPSGTEDIPGVWGHILSFLGGPRACIGYRFSVVEMKALLFVLLRSFEFELAVDPASIQKKQGAVSRPFVSTEAEVGDQMPLFVRHYRRC